MIYYKNAIHAIRDHLIEFIDCYWISYENIEKFKNLLSTLYAKPIYQS